MKKNDPFANLVKKAAKQARQISNEERAARRAIAAAAAAARQAARQQTAKLQHAARRAENLRLAARRQSNNKAARRSNNKAARRSANKNAAQHKKRQSPNKQSYPIAVIGAPPILPVIITYPNGRVERWLREPGSRMLFVPDPTKQFGVNLKKPVPPHTRSSTPKR